MTLLLLNAGSSSLKYSLLEAAASRPIVSETIESTGQSALDRVLREVRDRADRESLKIDGIVHRVVHGGSRFSEAVRITPEIRAALTELSELAPLHNPPSLEMIDAAMAAWPDVPQIAVFDTAFHATLAPEAFTYPVPLELSKRWGLRRFGFHGLSHEYSSRRAAEMLNRHAEFAVVVAHLGNGASVTAIRNGKSVDTSMGFTPLEGLMMGTRSGTVDPGLILHLERRCGVSADALDRTLNQESGLLGVSGRSSDMRTVLEASHAGDERATLAVRIFAHRARQAIGAMAVTLGDVDALVFTGGIGEHSAEVRAAICEGLSCLGLVLDADANASAEPDAVVSASSSRGRILVITAREDLVMARAARRCLTAS